MILPKKQRLIGWVMSGIITAFLIGPSAMGKFAEWEGIEGDRVDHILNRGNGPGQ